MSRVRAAAAAVAAAAALAAAPGAQAEVVPPYPCPNGFAPFLIPIYPPEVDKNGNFIVCAKFTDGTLVWHDDFLQE
jgi:hypothetical protein